jgi:hypothetical protein
MPPLLGGRPRPDNTRCHPQNIALLVRSSAPDPISAGVDDVPARDQAAPHRTTDEITTKSPPTGHTG